RNAVGAVFGGIFASADHTRISEWFDMGGTLQIEDTLGAAELLKRTSVVQGLHDIARQALPPTASDPHLASAVDFVLEGLYAHKKISRSEDRQYQAAEGMRRSQRPVPTDTLLDRELPIAGNKKKYYN